MEAPGLSMGSSFTHSFSLAAEHGNHKTCSESWKCNVKQKQLTHGGNYHMVLGLIEQIQHKQGTFSVSLTCGTAYVQLLRVCGGGGAEVGASVSRN